MKEDSVYLIVSSLRGFSRASLRDETLLSFHQTWRYHVHRNRADVPRVDLSEFRTRNTFPHQGAAEGSSNVPADIASREKRNSSMD